ncbi:hypothetical protein JCM19235_1617 [Vibrio maritimus]|uniref:Uncharacterized protein n=1 Tax=Vibrio maritimus TaxID=990268 RepID=A0A090S224_9VIBR|nr:hypothetical protein JCM19235_1617 [Vibrio maritimus]
MTLATNSTKTSAKYLSQLHRNYERSSTEKAVLLDQGMADTERFSLGY